MQREAQGRSTLRSPPDNNFDLKRYGATPYPNPRRPPRGAIEYSCQQRHNGCTTNIFPGMKSVSTFGRDEYVRKQGMAGSVGHRSILDIGHLELAIAAYLELAARAGHARPQEQAA